MGVNESCLPYLEAFFEETAEQLQLLEERLVALERNAGDSACLEDIFRVAHTLKGNAATMGFDRISRLAHHMEDLLDGVRKHSVPFSGEIADALLDCLDTLKELVEEASTGGGCRNDLASLLGRLENLARGGTGASGETAAGDERAYHVEVVLEDSCSMPAARSYIILRRLAELGDILDARPSLEEIQALGFEGGKVKARLFAPSSPATLAEALREIPEVREVSVYPAEEVGLEVEAFELEAGAEQVRIKVGTSLRPQEVEQQLRERDGPVVLDLSGLCELSPAGLRFLLSLRELQRVAVVPPVRGHGRKFLELLGWPPLAKDDS